MNQYRNSLKKTKEKINSLYYLSQNPTKKNISRLETETAKIQEKYHPKSA